MKKNWAVVAFCALVFAGCGETSNSDEDQIRDRLTAFAAAVEEEDPVAACDQLSPTVKESLPKRYGDCPTVIGNVLVEANESDAEALRDDVRKITISDNTATAEVGGEEYPMERVDGEWYVAE